MILQPTVFVVDDDQAVRESLRWLIASIGIKVETFASANEFLAAVEPKQPGCLVLDVRMPGLSGFDLHQKLSTYDISLPIIFITGHGDVSMAVRAMKAGAVDFISKPFNDQVLLDRIRLAIDKDTINRSKKVQTMSIESRRAKLTPREKEVMEMVISGNSNKSIAAQLGVSSKTIEAHRAKFMEKMQASSLPHLMRLALSNRTIGVSQ